MKKLRKIFAVWIGKLMITGSKLIGKKGSATAGRYALKIYPDILKELASQVKKEIIVVCGTNGKTTTNNMLYSILTANGTKVVCNKVGANMMAGIATAFVESADLLGNLDADYGCIEIDEASTVKIFDHFIPSKMVITNLFRDQLDRYGEIDITMQLLEKALAKAPNVEMLLNGDDPLTARFGWDTNRKCHYFGVDQDMKMSLNETKEGRFCTICGELLNYDYYHYSQLGSFSCAQCGFKRPDLDFRAYDVHVHEGLQFEIAQAYVNTSIHVNYKGFYNIYNILAAFSTASLLGVDGTTVNDVLSRYKPQIGRMETFHLGKPVVLNLSKNPAGFNQAISTVLQDPRPKDVLVVINDNAQDGRDISWIWDVDFERLSAPGIHSYIASGIRKEDVTIRFKYAELPAEKINVEGDIKTAVSQLISGSGEVCYVLVNYTALFHTQNVLKKLEKDYR